MTDCSDNYSQTTPQLSILVCLPKLPHSPLVSIPFQSCESRDHLIYSFLGLFFKLHTSTSNLSDVDMNRVNLWPTLLAARQARKGKQWSIHCRRTIAHRRRIWPHFWHTTKIHFNCRRFFSLTVRENYSKHKRFGAKVYLSVYVWTALLSDRLLCKCPQCYFHF